MTPKNIVSSIFKLILFKKKLFNKTEILISYYTGRKLIIVTLTKIVLLFQIILLTGCHFEKINFDELSVINSNQGDIYLYGKKRFTGVSVKKDSSGITTMHIENGSLEGPLEKLSLNQQPLLIEHYHKNRLNGKKTTFYEEGGIFQENFFWNDRLVGTFKIYYPNGRLQRVAQFDSFGRKIGIWKKYKIDGTISDSISYN